jgi:hypothetical protein
MRGKKRRAAQMSEREHGNDGTHEKRGNTDGDGNDAEFPVPVIHGRGLFLPDDHADRGRAGQPDIIVPEPVLSAAPVDRDRDPRYLFCQRHFRIHVPDLEPRNRQTPGYLHFGREHLRVEELNEKGTRFLIIIRPERRRALMKINIQRVNKTVVCYFRRMDPDRIDMKYLRPGIHTAQPQDANKAPGPELAHAP